MAIPLQPANIPPPQTSVAHFPNVAVAGQSSGQWYKDVRSRVAETAMAPGLGVASGAANGGVILPALTTDISAHFQGVVMMQELKEPIGPVGGPYSAQYRIGDAVPILAKGGIWVQCEDTMVDDGAVYCVYTTAVDGRTVGSFIASALSSATLVPNAKVRIGGVGTHAAPTLCLIEFATVA